MFAAATGFFAVPKAFKGRDAIHQTAAVSTWAASGLDVLLLGRDEGVAEAAARFHLKYQENLDYTETGVPVLSDVFRKARSVWLDRPLAYINSDILLPPSAKAGLMHLEVALERAGLTSFLVVARRCNLPISESCSPVDERTWGKLENAMATVGAWDGPHAIDFFMFSEDLFHDIPDFALGRAAWDNWLLAAAAEAGAAIVDASGTLPIIHAMHGYQHVPDGWREVWGDAEARRNLELAGSRLKNLDQVATHRFNGEEIALLTPENSFEPTGGEAQQAERYASLAMAMMVEAVETGSEKEAIDLAWLALDRCGRFTPVQIGGVSLPTLRKAASSRDLDLLEDGFAASFLQELRQIEEKGRDLWVWGAGGMAERLFSLCRRHGIEIETVLSADASEGGTRVNRLGRTAYPPESAFSSREANKPFVVIASMHKDSIGESLNRFGYQSRQDFTY